MQQLVIHHAIVYLQPSKNGNIPVYQFSAEQGLNKEQIHIHGIFFYAIPLASAKAALLQFVTIYLAAFIPLVPLLVTEIGNNWLGSTPEKSHSVLWTTRIYRIFASTREVLRASFDPHIFCSYHSLCTDCWHETVGLIFLSAVKLLI